MRNGNIKEEEESIKSNCQLHRTREMNSYGKISYLVIQKKKSIVSFFNGNRFTSQVIKNIEDALKERKTVESSFT